MATLLALVAVVMAALIVAGGAWIWKQYRFLRFLTEATGQLEGMLPGLQADMRAFEDAWQRAWEVPEWEAAEAHFLGPACPELHALYADPKHATIEEVRLFGPGAPPDGLVVRNYMPLSMRWTVEMAAGPERLPTDYVFAHPGDDEATAYVVDWRTGGPVYHVREGERVRVADSLTQFLNWEHRPKAERR